MKSSFRASEYVQRCASMRSSSPKATNVAQIGTLLEAGSAGTGATDAPLSRSETPGPLGGEVKFVSNVNSDVAPILEDRSATTAT